MGAVASVIVVDAVRQVDYREREMEFVAEAPHGALDEVVDKLLPLLDEE